YSYTLDEETTDNFGNILVEGEQYLPVVLTASAAMESNQKQFTNALSDISQAQPFVFHLKPKNNQN
ncbi:MAG: hypothetical protein KDD99_14295, partial [Bacteroidetes bacterium]|nr:hypothetical protein [Bacteroidota bacterium]